jgi:hypothetical protein
MNDDGLLALLASRRANGRGGGGGGGGKPSSSSSSSSSAFADAATATATSVASAIPNTGASTTEDVELEVESDGDNNVDWEDADQDDGDNYDEDDDNDDASQHHFPTRGVMINLGKNVGKSNHPDEEDNEGPPDEKIGRGNDEDGCDPSSSSRKRKRSTIRVLRNVPNETQRMILNIRRTQLLCFIARSLQCSYVTTCGASCISGDEFELYDDRLLLANVAYSLIPEEFHDNSIASPATKSKGPRASNFTIPSKHELRRFSLWCFQFLNQCGERRRAALQRNVAHGAAATILTSTSRQRNRKLPRNYGTKQSIENQMKCTMQESSSCPQNRPTVTGDRPASMNPQADLLRKVLYLSPHYDEDPQLLLEDEMGVVDAIDAVERITDHDKSLLFLTMARYVYTFA